MDISCIISSGDLELYVLGMLSQEDNEKVAQLAIMFPEIRKEIDEVQASLIQLSDDAAETDVPSAATRDNLFAKLSAMRRQEHTTAPVVATNHTHQAEVISMAKPRRTGITFLAAASVIALIICVAVIAHLSSANTHYHDVANTLQNQLDQVTEKAAQQQQQFASSLHLYQSPDYKKIDLKPLPGEPNSVVQLFWNQNTHNVFVADVSLPQAPAGKQYQLWAIVDGKPISAGMMNGKKVPQQMLDFEKADAFAITLEKTGGSETRRAKCLCWVKHPNPFHFIF